VIRKPDLAVVLDDNPVPLTLHASSYHGVFDLCVEALSTEKPGYVHKDLVVKKAEYAAGGVPEYFVLHREHGNVAFCGRTPGGVYAPLPVRGSGDGRIVCSRVLPGFQFRVADLLRRPDPNAMRLDPVYSDFVLPEWTLAEQAQVRVLRERDEATRDRDEATVERDEAVAAARREAAARAKAEAELARLRAAAAEDRKSD